MYKVVKESDLAANDNNADADEELEKMQDELIPSDKQEAKKSRLDMLQDIYKHTETRVVQNQQKLVDL